MLKKYWDKFVLGIIACFSAVLNLAGLGIEGYSNTYYTAAVKSMLMSWKNFFFASFDPAGFVSVDKPPLGLWLQTISASIFGVSGWSVILPQALAGVASVILIYYLVNRAFGKAAGLISAFALAVVPIFAATARSNTFENTLILVLMLACWAVMSAAKSGKMRHIVLAAVLVGIGFNIKMLQAYMVLPAIYLVYFLAVKIPLKKRIINSALSILVLLAVSFSWAVIVDLTPETERPYVGSSQNNSVIELIFGHNGMERLGLNRIFGGNRQQSDGLQQRPDFPSGIQPDKQFYNKPYQFNRQPGQKQEQLPNQMPDRMQPGQNLNFGGTGQFSPGTSGILRIFQKGLGEQVSWLIPIALLGFILAVIKEKLFFRLDNRKKISLALWIGWLVPVWLYFSFTQGLFHTYYLSMLAPPVAALSGIGAVYLWKSYKEDRMLGWLLPSGILATGIVHIIIQSRYPEWAAFLIPLIGVAAAVSALIFVVTRLIRKEVLNIEKSGIALMQKVGIIIALIAVFSAPTIWSLSPIIYGTGEILPQAGPNNSAGHIKDEMQDEILDKLISYLKENNTGEKYFAAALSASGTAASIILKSGEAVMPMGGFNGGDSILTLEELQGIINNGELKYFILDGRSKGAPGGNTELIQWIIGNCTQIPAREWNNIDTGLITNNNNMGIFIYKFKQ